MRFIDSPSVATLRPDSTAASATCCTRWTWLANAATTRRRSGWAANTPRSTSPTSVSERVLPGISELVESHSSSRTPSSQAMAPIRARSVRRPSTGFRSSLKSLECRITPWGVRMAEISPEGTEWVTGMNSQSNDPMLMRSWSPMGMRVVRSITPRSSRRWRINPRVNGEA